MISSRAILMTKLDITWSQILDRKYEIFDVFIEIVKQNIIFHIFRCLERKKGVSWEIKGLRGWQLSGTFSFHYLIYDSSLKPVILKKKHELQFHSNIPGLLWTVSKVWHVCIADQFRGFCQLVYSWKVRARCNFLNRMGNLLYS